MTNLRALAWDDKPGEYLTDLADRLKERKINVEVESRGDTFYRRFEDEHWDFIILDVIDTTSEPERPRPDAGIKLAERIRKKSIKIPIIFITQDSNELASGPLISGPILSRSKRLTVGEMVNDILDFVRVRVPDYTKVFLIYGHDVKAGGLRGDVLQLLRKYKLTVELITPEEAMSPLTSELINRMSPCGGFIALCTPDDKVTDNWYQPRQNVLLEIGIAMGLSEGLERLIILQRWGAEPFERAQLPSDLSGKLAIRFYDETNYSDALGKLIVALEKRGLRLQSA